MSIVEMCTVYKALSSVFKPRPFKYEKFYEYDYRRDRNEYDNREQKNYLMSAHLLHFFSFNLIFFS